MSCFSEEAFLLQFNTAAGLDENRVPATCRAHAEKLSWLVPRKLSYCKTTLQLTSMKTMCQLHVILVRRSVHYYYHNYHHYYYNFYNCYHHCVKILLLLLLLLVQAAEQP